MFHADQKMRCFNTLFTKNQSQGIDFESKSCYCYLHKGGVEMSEPNSWGFLLKQINDEVSRRANNAMRSYDMTVVQMNALNILMKSFEKKLSLKELEHSLHVAQSTAAGIVVRLEQKGFVESFGDPNDKRIKLVSITQAGEDCWLAAEAERKREEELMVSELTDAERDILLLLLQKVWDALK